MVNAGGMISLLFSTLAHFDIYFMKEMTFESLLVAIDRVKVGNFFDSKFLTMWQSSFDGPSTHFTA